MATTIVHLKKHWVAGIIALSIGFLCIAPYVYFAHTQDYRGITLLGQDAEEHYLARVQEVYDGHPSLSATFWNDKTIPYVFPPLGENIIARIGIFLHIDAVTAHLVAKGLFPFLVFLTLYALAYSLSGSRAAGLLAATSAMLTSGILSSPGDIVRIFSLTSVTDGIAWARPVNPPISSLFLFGALLLVWSGYFRKKFLSIFDTLALGTLVGLSIYLSPYTWGFMGILLVVLSINALYTKRWALFRSIVVAGICALLLALPFASNMLAAHATPGFEAAMAASNAQSSRAPQIGFWIIVLLCLPFAVWNNIAARRFFFISALALFIALNQQVVSGFALQPGHFHWYITKPLVGLLLGLACWEWVKKFHINTRVQNTLCGLGVVYLLFYAVVVQAHFYKTHVADALAAQAYAPVIAYVNTLPKDVSIFTTSTLSDYLAIYTSANAINDNYVMYYLMPPDARAARLELQSVLNSSTSTTPVSPLLNTLHTALLIEDTSNPWHLSSELVPQAHIGTRFVVYKVSTTTSKK